MAELLLGAGGPKLLLPLLRAASALAERRARGVVAALARAAGLGGPDGLGGKSQAAGVWAAVRRALGRRHVLGDELRDALLEVRHRPPLPLLGAAAGRCCRCAGRAHAHKP
jgi:hypothetical protein